MLTVYDFLLGTILDEAGLEILLVGNVKTNQFPNLDESF